MEVSNIKGTAVIENNELVEVGGRGDMVIHPLNDMKGWFEVKWSTSGGVETYEGTGNVAVHFDRQGPQDRAWNGRRGRGDGQVGWHLLCRGRGRLRHQ